MLNKGRPPTFLHHAKWWSRAYKQKINFWKLYASGRNQTRTFRSRVECSNHWAIPDWTKILLGWMNNEMKCALLQKNRLYKKYIFGGKKQELEIKLRQDTELVSNLISTKNSSYSTNLGEKLNNPETSQKHIGLSWCSGRVLTYKAEILSSILGAGSPDYYFRIFIYLFLRPAHHLAWCRLIYHTIMIMAVTVCPCPPTKISDKINLLFLNIELVGSYYIRHATTFFMPVRNFCEWSKHKTAWG